MQDETCIARSRCRVHSAREGRGMATEREAIDVDEGALNRETHLRILQAGAECLARFGNDKTSVQDVADMAKVSRATVYRYFPDRAALFQSVTMHERERIR